MKKSSDTVQGLNLGDACRAQVSDHHRRNRALLRSGISHSAAALAIMFFTISVDLGTQTQAFAASNVTINSTPSGQVVLHGTSGTDNGDEYFDVGDVTVGSGVNLNVGDTTAVSVQDFVGGYSYNFINNGTLSYSGTDNDVVFFSSDSGVAIKAGGTFTNNGSLLGHMTNEYGDGLALRGSLDGTITNSSSGVIKLDFVNETGPTPTGAPTDSWRAIFVEGDIGATGSIVNAGTLAIEILSTKFAGPSSSTAASGAFYGIKVDGDVNGSISNSGTIDLHVERMDDVSATGIFVDGDLTTGASIVNSGTINIAVTPKNTDGWSTFQGIGIEVGGAVNGTVTNTSTGTISVKVNATAATISGGSGIDLAGIRAMGGVGATGSIINDGKIDLQVNNVIAYYMNDATTNGGIVVGDELAGKVINNGSISYAVTGQGITQSTWTIQGVYIDSIAAAGAFTNSTTGTIDVSMTASAGTDKHIYGVIVEGDNLGTMTNAGRITVTGDMLVTVADGSAGSIEAFGIYVNGLAGTLSNSGTVSVTSANADADKPVLAYGVRVGGVDSGNSLTNDAGGTVMVSATGSGGGSASASAWGILIDGNVTGGATFGNAGTINVNIANAGTGDSYGYGVQVAGYLDTDFTNTGTISAEANGGLAHNSYSVVVGAVAPTNSYAPAVLKDGVPGTVRNQAGGLLKGNLYLGNGVSLANSGMVWLPEDANGGDAAYVGGNFSQSDTGTLMVHVYGADPDQHSQLIIDGSVDLAGELYVNVRDAGQGPLQVGQRVNDVIVTNTVSGISNNFATVNDNSFIFNFTSIIDGDTVDLDVTKGITVYEATKARNLRPAYGAAKVLDKFAFGPGGPGNMQPVIDALSTLGTEKEVAEAAYQTLPLFTGGASRLIRDVVTVTSYSVNDRMNGMSGEMIDVQQVSRNFWIDPIGAWTHQTELDESSGYDSTMYGVVAGLDGNVTSALSMGAAFAYVNTQADTVSDIIDNSASVNSYQAMLYGIYDIEGGSVFRYQLDGGYHNTNGQRHINFGYGPSAISDEAKSDYGNTSLHAAASFEHGFALSDRTSFTPRLRADYISVWSEGYDESGAGVLNLSVDQNQYQTLVFALDGRAEHYLSESVSLEANGSVGYDVLNERSEVTAAYAGAPDLSFDVAGMQTDGWIADAGVGISFRPSEDFKLSANYNAIFRDGFISNMAGLEANWRF